MHTEPESFRELQRAPESFRELQRAAIDDTEKLIENFNFKKIFLSSCKSCYSAKAINYFLKKQILVHSAPRAPRAPRIYGIIVCDISVYILV